MTLAFQSAFDDLRRVKNVYQKLNRTYDGLSSLTETSGLAMKDPSFLTAPAIDDVRLSYATLSAVFSNSFSNVMLGFRKSIRTSAFGVEDLLIALLEYMDRNALRVQSRGTVIEAAVNPAVPSVNTGTQKLFQNTKTAEDWVDESVSVETLIYRLNRPAANLASRGRDLYDVESSARSGESEFDGGGVGAPDGSILSIPPGRSIFFSNASFDESFNGSGVAKIPGVTILSGDGNIAHSTSVSDIAENRGGAQQGALLITGACEFEIDFILNGQNLPSLAGGQPIIFGIRADVSSAATFTLKLDSANTAGADEYKETFVVGSLAAYTEYVVDPDTKNGWPEIFDVDNRAKLTITVASVTGTLKLDDLILDILETNGHGGLHAGIVAGITTPAKDDTHTSIRRASANFGSVEVTGGSGDITALTVDGVSIISNTVSFDSDAATTAILLMEEINETRSDPNYLAYIAAAAPAKVLIYQTKPDPDTVGNTLVVNATGSLATTDVNLTAGDLGTINDLCVRHLGFSLPNAASATAGLAD